MATGLLGFVALMVLVTEELVFLLLSLPQPVIAAHIPIAKAPTIKMLRILFMVKLLFYTFTKIRNKFIALPYYIFLRLKMQEKNRILTLF